MQQIPELIGKNSAPPRRIDEQIAEYAVRQHGLVTARQLRACGLSDVAVSRRSSAGRLHRLYPGVYAVGHVAPTRELRWMAAVLAAGDGAALGYLAAARHWDAWRREVDTIDVVSSRRATPRPGVRYHVARNLLPRDVLRRRSIPVTSVARTLLDLGDVLTPHQLANVIHEAEFRRRFRRPAVDDVIRRARGRRAVTVLRAALVLHDGGSAGTRSALEDRCLELVMELARDLGWDAPLVNVRIAAPDGEPIEVDLHWPRARLVVEVDGSGHLRQRTQQDDAARDERLRCDGWTVIRVTPADLTNSERLRARLAAGR